MLIFGARRLFTKKLSNSHTKQFFAVFPKNTAFFEKIVEEKTIQHLLNKGYKHFW